MLKSRNYYIDYFIIAIVVIIGYWQIALLQFSIKCDAALLSLPWKKFVSDSLRSGYFPIWNPYINLGWTQAMEPSTWYYPSWIFALFGKYRLSYLHAEITLHFILGGIGMYKLLSMLKLDRWALLSGSLVYILSGFFVGNLQHLGWTFYGCWLPLVLFYFFSLIKDPRFIIALKFGLTGAMLVMSSYIPFTMTTFIFLLITTSVVILRNFRLKKNADNFQFIKYVLLSIVVLFIICSPCFYMLFINMDTMYRGGKYDDNTAAFGSLVPMSWIGFIAPFGTIAKNKMWSATDISMNNIFIGIISFVLIGFAFADKKKRKWILLVSGIGLVAFMFALGRNIPPTWFIFRHLPFYEKLRFASQFRVYFIMAAAILAAIGSNYLLRNDRSKKIEIFLIISCILWISLGLSGNFEVFFKHFNAIFVREKNDYSVVQSIKFQALVWGMLFFILTIVHFVTRKKYPGIIKKLIVFNVFFLVVAAQMNMFYTGVANEKVVKIDSEWTKLPDRFHPVQNKSYKDYWKPGIGLTWTNVGTLYQVPNINCYHPYDSKNYGEYLKFQGYNPQNSPLIYSKYDTRDHDGNINYVVSYQTDHVELNPYGIKFETASNADTLYIQMSASSYTQVLINNNSAQIHSIRSMIALLDVPAKSKVVICFLPKYVTVFGWIGMISFITIIFLVLGIPGILKRIRKMKGR